MTRKTQIPLNEVMAALDTRNYEWYNELSDERKRAFSIWMMMRYASSVEGDLAPLYLYYVNECVNINFSEISKHPELQWKLMATCGRGIKKRHYYVKPPTSRRKKDKVSEFLLSIYPHLKTDELTMLRAMNTDEELQELAKQHGYDDKTIKEIWK
jgi:hypothetical protein